MEKSKFVDGIYKRLDYLADMATINKDSEYNTLELELNDLEKKIVKLQTKIKAYTPNDKDIQAAKNDDQLILTSKQTELNGLKYQSNNKQDQLQEYNKELTALLEEEQQIVSEKSNLEIQVQTFKKYTVNSREFKSFVNTNLNDLDALEKKLEDIKKQQKKLYNAIDVLNKDNESLISQITIIESDIYNLENRLGSDKYYLDAVNIVDKVKFKEELEVELKEYQTRKEEIENSPVYLAKKIKDIIDSKGDYDNAISYLNKIVNIALNKPYMNVVIKNGDSKELEEKCNQLNKERARKNRQIKKTDYSLSKLPFEESRSNSLEQLINSIDKKVEMHESVIDINKTAISVLSSQVKELEEKYNQRCQDIKNYCEKVAVEADSSNKKAAQKLEAVKMQKEMDDCKSIITNYKNDIVALITANENEQKTINELKETSKIYAKEMTGIARVQSKRTNYSDLVKQAQDQVELQELNQEIAAIEARLKYKNFNVQGLKSEITQGLKKVLVKPKKEEKIEPKIAQISESDALKVADLLKQQDDKEKDKIKEEVDSFEQTLNTIYKKEDNLNINMNEIVEKEINKTKEQKPIDTKIDLSFDLAHMDKQSNEKLKVISIEPVLKQTEVLETENVDKIRVVSVEPLRKNEASNKNATEPRLNATEIMNLIYNPFAQENLEPELKRVA